MVRWIVLIVVCHISLPACHDNGEDPVRPSPEASPPAPSATTPGATARKRAPGDAARGAGDRPHVVIFFADDLGFADVGYHGGEPRTPTIDRLAEGGVRFTQFYAQNLCSPSRAALLTGRYPFRMRLHEGVVSPWDRHGLPNRERTIAEALSDRGYQCAMIGKWHLGRYAENQLPMAHGFAFHYGCYTGGVDYMTHRTYLDGHDWFRCGDPVLEPGYATDLLANEAEAVLAEHDPETPLFLYVPFTAPHVPLQAIPSEFSAYPSTMKATRRAYCAMVTRMDKAIARIVTALRDRGMFDETLIIFASDNGGVEGNGGADNGPFRGGKGTHYEGGVRVPALMHWPGRIDAGAVVNEPLHLVDLYPTLLGLTGATHGDAPALDGKDAWKVITDGATGLHDEIPLSIGNRFIDTMRAGKWKILRFRETVKRKGDSVELYDLDADPGETTNVAAKHPKVLARLVERLDAWRAQATEPHAEAGRPAGYKPHSTLAPDVKHEPDDPSLGE